MTATHHHHKEPKQQQVDWTAWIKSLLLLGMGIYLALLILTGNLDNYINQRFAWLAYLGAAIFFLLGLVNLYSSLKPEDDDHHHHHYQITWDMLLVAAFPLLLAILIPSRSLGIEAINGGISLSPVGVASASAFTRSPLDRNILDWLREFDRANSPASFNDLPVDVTGFVYREPTFAEDSFMISRFTMSCCVADAFPIGMPVRFDAASDFTAGTWVRVSGELQAADFGDDFLPIVFASSIEAIDEPEQPYLYP